MRPLTASELADIRALIEFYRNRGAFQPGGIHMRHSDAAAGLGWPWWHVHKTVRLLKEHPELGTGITINRGPDPVVILSDLESPLLGEGVPGVERVGRSGYRESVLRAARYTAAGKVQYNNASDKRSANARLLLRELRREEGALTNLRATLDPGSPPERQIQEFIDEVLAI